MESEQRLSLSSEAQALFMSIMKFKAMKNYALINFKTDFDIPISRYIYIYLKMFFQI